MKSFFKAVSLITTTILLISLVAFSAFAFVDVDGVISTREWENAKNTIIYSNTAQSANNISYAEVKTIKSDSNTIYLAVTATDDLDEYLDDCGVLLTIPSVGTYTFGVDNTSDFQNNNFLNIQYGTTANTGNLFFFEFKLTFKKAISDYLQLKLQLKDGAEVLSREVSISDFTNTELETTSITTTKTHTNNTTKYSEDNRTTKFKTDNSTEATAEKVETTTEELTSVSEVLHTDKTSNSKILGIVLSLLALVLVFAACFVLLSAKPKSKDSGETKENEDKKNDSDSQK